MCAIFTTWPSRRRIHIFLFCLRILTTSTRSTERQNSLGGQSFPWVGQTGPGSEKENEGFTLHNVGPPMHQTGEDGQIVHRPAHPLSFISTVQCFTSFSLAWAICAFIRLGHFLSTTNARGSRFIFVIVYLGCYHCNALPQRTRWLL